MLDTGAAKVLDAGVRAIDKALRADDPQRVSAEADKLVQDYDKGVQDRTITSEATRRLDPLLADLTTAVDTLAAG